MNTLFKRFPLFVAVVFASFTHASAAQPDLVQYVNTLQGTNSHFGLSHGNTFPAVAMPFAQHMWTAQTGQNGDGFKYLYTSDEIRGFGQSHQCSPWVSDYAVYSFFPEVGGLEVDAEKRGAKFSHANEEAHPHYYAVRFDNGVRTEFATTDRCAHFRFSYPRSGEAYLVIDGYTGQSEVMIDPEKRQIRGWVNNQRFVNHAENFRNYFVVQFDAPFEDYGIWEGENKQLFPRQKAGTGNRYGAYLKFRKGTKVQAKAASSYISPQQAELTLQQELGKDKNVEATKARGWNRWNTLLNRIVVEGGTEEQTRTFYSCLFRSNLFSRMFYELRADGTPYYYSPYDGKIYEGRMFTDNGLWDTFRSQFPLTNILHPTQQGHYMNALLAAQKQCGWLPSWSFPGETGGMCGNHSISLLADAWAKGIRSFDPDSALVAYAHEAMNKGPWGGANGRAGWKEYFELGFVAFPESHGSVTQTLEYAYDDWCAYQLAKSCGNAFYERVFAKQMFNYKNLWDAETGFFRGRLINGDFYEPFDPLAWGGPYTEGNAWHYIWSVFHDVEGLIRLFGSEAAFCAKMDSVFSQTNDVHPAWYGFMIHEMVEMQQAEMGQYAHGNQPIQHMPYLYSYAGQPWKTQYWVRQIMDRLYNSTENGFPGDEDQGGMSSWYVLSALGLYAVTPGTNQYVIGSPVFRKATLTLENGNRFVIEARDNSQENVYIQQGSLNGMPLDRNYITYDDINRGGTLSFQMGDKPNTQRNTSKSSAPYSVST
ncbi:MAG: glycoside hydrolase family 92 protein, partial [Bacteroidaceae bacterium]|nr:glycoside hydrolase family 92 protein [Bacteroidaceae bacterium]